jgi:N-acyl homoserine lactone hydrolase
MTDLQKLYVLLCGYEIIPKTVSTRDRGARFVLSVPISAYLLETRQGLLLIDAGANSALVNDPALCHEYYGSRGWYPPVIFPQHEITAQLDAIGVQPRDVERVLLSHMHLDHTGNLKLFPHARIFVQRLEYEYAFGEQHSPAWFDVDYRIPGLRWEQVEGDWDVMPGLRCLLTRGHTPGHQSFVVELPESGSLVLAADAGDLHENFDEEILPGESVDDAAALASIRRLKQIATERGSQLIIGHDPQQIQRLRLAPDCYR